MSCGARRRLDATRSPDGCAARHRGRGVLAALRPRHEKLELYAETGITEYWVVDAERSEVHVHTQPDRATRAGYRECPRAARWRRARPASLLAVRARRRGRASLSVGAVRRIPDKNVRMPDNSELPLDADLAQFCVACGFAIACARGTNAMVIRMDVLDAMVGSEGPNGRSRAPAPEPHGRSR